MLIFGNYWMLIDIVRLEYCGFLVGYIDILVVGGGVECVLDEISYWLLIRSRIDW